MSLGEDGEALKKIIKIVGEIVMTNSYKPIPRCIRQGRINLVKNAIIKHCFPSLNEQMEIKKYHRTFFCKHIAKLIPNMSSHGVSFYFRILVKSGFIEIFNKTPHGTCRYKLNDKDFNDFRRQVF